MCVCLRACMHACVCVCVCNWVSYVRVGTMQLFTTQLPYTLTQCCIQAHNTKHNATHVNSTHTHTHLEQFVHTLGHIQRHSCRQNWTLLYTHTVERILYTQGDASGAAQHMNTPYHHSDTSWACTANACWWHCGQRVRFP